MRDPGNTNHLGGLMPTQPMMSDPQPMMRNGQVPEVGVEDVTATPEEQDQYDRFIDKAIELISKPDVFRSLMTRIDQDPVDGLAVAAVTAVQRVQAAAERAGEKIDGGVMFHGGVEIIETLADDAATLGIYDFTPEDLEAATYRAMDLYRESMPPDPAAVQDDMQALLEADRAGRLGEVLPGIDGEQA